MQHSCATGKRWVPIRPLTKQRVLELGMKRSMGSLMRMPQSL